MMRLRSATTIMLVALCTVPRPCLAQSEEVLPDTAAHSLEVTPLVTLSRSASSLRDSLVALARAQVGRRYVFGGESPERGFDCSGLIQYLLATFDTRVPRTAAQQARVGAAVERDTVRLRPGDLLTFGRGTRASHIGIYVGNGRFVHASSAAGRVIESPLNRRPSRLIKPWRGARRLLIAGDSTQAADTLRGVRAGG